jgi:predicted nucleic acid-binding protein
MQKIIISDTSCLILLDKIGALNLLNQLFKTITITAEIAEEFNKVLPQWIVIENPVNKNYQKILEATLDKGEASAIPFEQRSFGGFLFYIFQIKKSDSIIPVNPF